MNELTAPPNVDFFAKLLDKIAAFLPELGTALVLLLLGMLVRRIVLSVMNKAFGRSKLDKTVCGFLISSANVLITAFVLIIVLSVLGIPMTSIIAVFSAAGLAIGLALQDSLGNVAGGFIILLSKPFKAGDYISAAGTEGTVEEITILTTKLITPDNKDIFIPNGSLSKAVITNFTGEDKRRVDLVFGISYDDDSAAAEEIILKTAAAHSKVLDDPNPLARVISLGESSVDITVRVWVHSADYWDVYFDLTEQIKARFDKEGITIPYKTINISK